ncbi:MAG: glutamate synthase subunit beta [Clostridia bacterium]|nr:glutamate synthase subunit beta [Clostridia bacterium]
MGKATGFLEYKRKGAKYVEPQDRLNNFDEFVIPLDEKEQQIQAARCMDCGIPFCLSGVMYGNSVSGCPNGNLIPEWNELIYQGNYKEAWERLCKTNPLPEMTSRVCPAPCEGACTNGIDGEPVTIHYNERLISDKAFANGWVREDGEPILETGKKVAIVGSGPAGLSAAWRLNKLGHKVTVYERNDTVGGLLMYGIPNMKLDKDVVAQRVNIMKDLGIKFILNCNVGKDISYDQLNAQYDAILLTGGSTVPRDLNIPGRDLSGVKFAVDFLTDTTKTLLKDGPKSLKETMKGMNVIVIGGGDTGNDCVGTSLRRGAHVEQFEIMPEAPENRAYDNPWPTFPRTKKTDYGQQEAIYLQGKDPRTYEINTLKFNGEDGKVVSVDTVKIKWKKNTEGRFIPVPIEGTEKTYKADLVLLCMGFTGPEQNTLDEFNITVPREGYSTINEKVFVAGDMRRGQSLVIWAIYEGRSAAEEIDAYLMKNI